MLGSFVTVKNYGINRGRKHHLGRYEFGLGYGCCFFVLFLFFHFLGGWGGVGFAVHHLK